ncbi:O-antigen ligase family protein [Bacillus carboniphilus]|uniref:O-antigen ligase family protein n=1 Tax=Bacillus carboniphilus TaxID=86663 RepID=A0ABN0VRK0_9BACI
MSYNFSLHNYWFYFIAILVISVAVFLPTTITLVVISALAAILAWVRPKEALLLMALYIPIRTFLVEMNSGFTLTGDILTFVLVLKVLWDTKGEVKSWFRFHPFELAFFAFLIVGAVSGVITGASITAVIFQIRTYLIMYLLYYVVSRMNLKPEDFVRFAWVNILTATVICLQGIIEKVSLRTWLIPQTWSEAPLSLTNFMRIYGLPNNPNTLAIYLSITVLLVLFILPKVVGAQKKVLYVLLVLFLGVNILTFSRGTFIALVIGFAFYLILTKHWKVIKPMILATIAAYLLVYLPVTFGTEYVNNVLTDGTGKGAGGLADRLQDTFDEETRKKLIETGRVFYIKKGFEIFLDHPVIGTGFATFGDSATLSYGSPIYKDYDIPDASYYGFNIYTDNQYIGVITETGAVGVVLFAIFLLGMLWIFWKRRKEDDPRFSYFMVALWFSTAAMAMYYNIWELKLFTFFYFVVFGVYASKYNLYKINHK